MLTTFKSAVRRLPGDAPEAALALDDHLPTFDATVRRHVVIDTDPERVYRAVWSADMLETGAVMKALSQLRVVPELAARAFRSDRSSDTPETERLTLQEIVDTEWFLLDDREGTEVVFGAVGKFWQPVIEWREIDPDAFDDFHEPGWGKLAASISLRPYGEGRTVATYEARTLTTDAESRRKFRRYWTLIGPFAGYVMKQALRRIGADAEAVTRATTLPADADAAAEAVR